MKSRVKASKVQTEYTNEKRSIDGGKKPRMHGACARRERGRKKSCLYSKERWQRDSGASERACRDVWRAERERTRAGGAAAEGTEHEEHLRLNFVCF